MLRRIGILLVSVATVVSLFTFAPKARADRTCYPAGCVDAYLTGTAGSCTETTTIAGLTTYTCRYHFTGSFGVVTQLPATRANAQISVTGDGAYSDSCSWTGNGGCADWMETPVRSRGGLSLCDEYTVYADMVTTGWALSVVPVGTSSDSATVVLNPSTSC